MEVDNLCECKRDTSGYYSFYCDSCRVNSCVNFSGEPEDLGAWERIKEKLLKLKKIEEAE